MRTRAISASLLFGTALAVGGWWIGQERVQPPELSAVRTPEQGARLFEQVYGYIATQYVDSLPLDSLYRKAVAGLVEELNDPYSAFLPESRMRRLESQIAGHYGGVGMQVDIRDGWLTVMEPYPGTPADRAGVLAGDRIVAIEEESTNTLSLDEVSRLLRGEPGSKVSFTIERFGVHRFDVSLEREAVVRRAVPRVVMLRPGVGYVDVNVFGENTANELRLALDSLNHLGAHSVVLDLRGNPGGLLEQGVAVSELFLDPDKRIVELRGRPGVAPEQVVARDPQWWPKLAVAVLVDGNSASASEIVAGALQDHDRAIVVGHTSYGKGSAQTIFPMNTGGALRITTARWYTPLGRSISQLVDTSGARAAALDTTRPRFTTAMGRTVFGGGGIVPDVVAGDAELPVAVQQFVRSLGTQTASYRDAVSRVALTLRQQERFTTPMQPVTRAMVDEVWTEMQRRNLRIVRAEFDSAAPWIGRALGYEATRLTFGSDAEFMRRSEDDASIARALRLLEGVSSPREPFARAEANGGVVVPMRLPSFEE